MIKMFINLEKVMNLEERELVAVVFVLWYAQNLNEYNILI